MNCLAIHDNDNDQACIITGCSVHNYTGLYNNQIARYFITTYNQITQIDSQTA